MVVVPFFVIFADLLQSASNALSDVSVLESSISALERAISDLESAVKALESKSPPWEYSVWVFTFLVAVGVALELWIIRHEWRDDMEAWALAHFGVLRSPSRPSRVKLRVEVASVLLITIGVMGELVVGIHIASINGELRGKSAELRSKNADLRSKSDQLLALVTRQAGDAEKSAQQVRATAAILGSWMEAIGNALRQPILSPQQIKAISDEMRPLATPNVRITIITTYGAIGLASGIANAIKGAGFTDPDFDIRTSTSPEISMGSPMDREHRKVAEALFISILRNGRLPGMGIIAPLRDGSPVEIVVGQHLTGPIPPFPMDASRSNPNK
jgi:hypothetical protein